MLCRNYILEFFRSFMCKIRLSANRDHVTSLPIYITFISFSCLSALARNSKTMLSRSGEIGHPCLLPDLRGSGFNFSPFTMMRSL
jgi:hypothetical protein